jgi:hypothetical protein
MTGIITGAVMAMEAITISMGTATGTTATATGIGATTIINIIIAIVTTTDIPVKGKARHLGSNTRDRGAVIEVRPFPARTRAL